MYAIRSYSAGGEAVDGVFWHGARGVAAMIGDGERVDLMDLLGPLAGADLLAAVGRALGLGLLDLDLEQLRAEPLERELAVLELSYNFV